MAPRSSSSRAPLPLLLVVGLLTVATVKADTLLSAPLNVTIRDLEKRDVRMLRMIQEVNTTTRSCVLWDLDEDTEYIVHVQSLSAEGSSPLSEALVFRTPRESEKMASKSPDENSMEGFDHTAQLRAGELIIIVVVLYDIIKDNEPSNNKDKAKTSSECSTPEHPQGGLLRSNV
ncbi:hypothetical protein NHX12_023277 [Muraenolepis orangiensis]|uniref:Fibronectin type-III domain-containing protein n=1 Tax=Muraenolepis orangiensis TaxID=630683 RepID=A0A9Q0EQK6_9TELE|nr:hypothetical protein NHX12_023277 [Muraenolepis orangiensis]